MNPEKHTDAPSTIKIAESGDFSLAHFLSTRTASSRDTVMYLLAERQFGRDAAMGMASWLKWDVDGSVLNRV